MCPVVLPAKSHPAELAIEHAGGRQRFCSFCERAEGRGGREVKKRLGSWERREAVMRVEVCCVVGKGKVAEEQAVKKGLLYVWREEIGDELDTRDVRENIDWNIG